MNNQQFRKLVFDTPARQNDATSSPKPMAPPSNLGSKRSSFVPMTPRTVRGGGGVDFARQMAERNAGSQPTKKFRSSAAPKGAKLGEGYRDRTQDRREEEEDDKAARIKALEEQMKLGQIEPAVFEQLRDQITGGDIGSTHLVKGLDRQLLERIRRGEDVLSAEGKGDGEKALDVDDEFERLEEQEVQKIEREKVQKKGEMAAPQPVAGLKRSRDDILKELKAQREAARQAKAAARPELGSKFKSISASKQGPKVEIDAKGREVMTFTDEHGNVKRKVRKVQQAAMEPEKPTKFLDEGVTIPELKAPAPKVEEAEEEDDDDIFEGAGTEYNPLGDMDDDDDDSDFSADEGTDTKPLKSPTPTKEDADSEAEEGEIPLETEPSASKSPTTSAPPPDSTTMPPPPAPSSKPRNYFKSAPTSSEPTTAPHNPLSDPSFLAAIRKAGSLTNFKMRLSAEGADGPEDEDEAAREARLKKRAAMLAANDRDLEDMDMGFGGSRFDDDEGEEEGKKIKLSEWKGGAGGDDEGWEEDEGGKGGKRKRGRKRKGDKNSAADVLGVLERRKGEAK